MFREREKKVKISQSALHMNPSLSLLEQVEKDMENVKWAIGTTLYFAGIGLWFIVVAYLLGWAIVLALPTLCIGWIIGWISRSFTRRTELWPAFRSFWLWEKIRTSYFEYEVYGPGTSLVEREMSDQEKNKVAAGSFNYEKLMWTVYPHGILPWTAIFFWGVNPAFKKVIPCIHSTIFMIPLLREMAGWMGCTTVSEQDIKCGLWETGRIVMAPGGIADIANEGNDIKKRRGFLRVAKEAGAHVVPVWIPEERSYYRMWMPLGRSLEKWLRYPVPMFIWGMTLMPLLPKRVKTRIFVGDPIYMKDRDIEKGYEMYYKAIKQLQEQARKKE